MNDTSELMGERFAKMLMQRSSQERLKMGCSMFGAAKQIVKSSILNKDSQLSARELRRQIFLRFYGQDLQDVQLKKIIELI